MSEPLRQVYVAEPPAHYLSRPPAVADCSMLCAVLFDEPERDEALRALSGRQLLAPTLLSHEVVSVAAKKLRHGMPEAAIRRALADFAQHDIELLMTDPLQQFALALRYGLSAYDAAYLWLAAERKAPLMTFDRRLAIAAQDHLGALD